MLLELAIGDAYGAGFEYTSREFVLAHNDLSQYYQHPKHKSLRPGRYTDDTQMAIAIAELCVSGLEWTPLNIANAFVDTFKRDSREGYSQAFYQILCSVQSGSELLARIRPDSIKNGAAMRAGPIGVAYNSIDEVLEKSRLQAMVTHNTDIGIRAAQASALMSYYFSHEFNASEAHKSPEQRRPRDQLGKFIEKYVPGNWSKPFRLDEVGGVGWMAVNAAITAIQEEQPSQAAILKRCINFTGDVDTVAAIAMGAIGMSSQFEYDIPDYLFQSLEDGKFGAGYLGVLSKRLWY